MDRIEDLDDHLPDGRDDAVARIDAALGRLRRSMIRRGMGRRVLDELALAIEPAIVEVVDADGRPCRPGEIGRVLVTDLTNFATPVIRYDIGDYAEVGEPATCGRGLPTLSRIVGRDRNLIVMPDGTRRWPLTGYHRFPEVGPILQFQFIQVDRDTIEAHLVTGRPFNSRDERAFRDIVCEALGHPFELVIHYHEGALQRGPNGKFEDFVCRVVP